MGVLLGRCPADMQVSVTWASRVVPSGVSLSEQEKSLVDMHLGTLSKETAGSDRSEPLAVG